LLLKQHQFENPCLLEPTIATIIADSIKVKLSGLTNACLVAKNAPAKPPKVAPIAKAVSFVFVGLTPRDLHAISSSS
jgi:hypothetical protein